MPNHVTHKVIFYSANAEEIFAAICVYGCIDFDKLVPRPPHVYNGDISQEDEKDFPCNGLSWQRENWGTKWNAYDGSTMVEGDKAIMTFDTAWSIPYPVMAAFCNRFNIPFEHRYFDEGSNFWGIEQWGTEKHGGNRIARIVKRKSLDEDKVPLCIELKGYDPNSNDEE